MATLIQILENTLGAKDPLISNETKRIILKEALQAYVLDFLYNHRSYRNLNFYGGTCLHVIYSLNRLSEDIDLDNSQDVYLGDLADDLLDYIQKYLGYQNITIKLQESQEGIMRLTLRFSVVHELGLSPNIDERLHLKVEISHHRQTAIIEKSPVIFYGRSFVPAHFSLETMMAGKMLACLERSFQVGDSATLIKGRDYYDLLWFMQQHIEPLEEKLENDGAQSYDVTSAMLALQDKIGQIRAQDLSLDLLPLFEQRSFIEAWIDSFHENFNRFLGYYL
jgi:predicted nucleotidyltransferase component of viral defense system